MAYESAQINVAQAPVAIYTPGDVNRVLARGAALIYNAGAAPVFLGGAGVTAATGFELAAGRSVAVATDEVDVLYAVAVTGIQRLDVLLAPSAQLEMEGGLVELNADAGTGALSGGIWTLGVANTAESVPIPDWARGVRLRPSADVRFAVNEAPVAAGVEALTVGNTAYANETATRTLQRGSGRTLRLVSATVGATVDVGFC